MSGDLQHYLQEHERNRALVSGDALAAVRESALQQFQELGFPTRRQENWKYTDVRKLLKQPFRYNTSAAEIASGRVRDLQFSEPACHVLVFINGIFSPSHSDPGTPGDEIILTDLDSALNEHEALIKKHIAAYSDSNSSGFTALNTAFLNHGSVLSVPAGATFEKPVHLLYINTTHEHPFTSQTRNLLLLGENTDVTVIESYIGLDDAVYFTNTVTQILLESASRLTHYRIQQESRNSFHLGHTPVHLKRDSHYESNVISMGAELSRTDLDCRLEEAGAETRLNGLYMANGNQHTDHHIRVDHLVPNTRSDQNYRGILDERGRAGTCFGSSRSTTTVRSSTIRRWRWRWRWPSVSW